ncbi:DUF3703 domain-containing protein [Kangiella sp.]|uniref:DUF3703 domain-containing protein n=1 Tax=Kangiella sp. TaxID=1920245 RepID=UPI0019AF27DB|nr:DUF3703 domain-containing protein [Kangiella sp.]MBD3653479.1 DUF3703 domain-containing protein [Kangiella sp.]
MSQKLRMAFANELNKGKLLFYKGQLDEAFYHFERAHILSQPFYVRHVKSHWWMFRIGIKRIDLAEIFGQIIRIIGSAGSLFGKYPVGNTGGANVSPFKPMPIPEDLKVYFE